MPTIESVTARPVDLPLDRPVETAAGTMRTMPFALIDLVTSDGVPGRGYLRSYTPVALDALVRLVRALADLVTGGPADPAPVHARLSAECALVGTAGLVGMAIGGLDMVLWDAAARAAGHPLATFLGATPEPVPAYGCLRSMRPAAAAAEAADLVARGFTGVKVKVGGADLAADLATVRAVREAVGDQVEIMVDYNQSLGVAEAIERVRVLDDEGLAWIEEPTRAQDDAGHARIAAAARTPVQIGENWWGPADVAASIAAGASDHVTLDVMKLGGVTGWLRAADLAAGAGLPASSHSFGEFSRHLLAATPTAYRFEYFDHAAPLLAEPLEIVDSAVRVPDRPGAGIEWDKDFITFLTSN